MTLEKARELIGIQATLGSGYNRNATRLILREVQNEHGRGAVDTLIREFDLERIFELDFSAEVSRKGPCARHPVRTRKRRRDRWSIYISGGIYLRSGTIIKIIRGCAVGC